VPLRQWSFRQFQGFCAVHSNPARILGPSFFIFREKQGLDWPFSILNSRIPTRSEGTRITSTRQSYYGIRSTLHTKSMTRQLPTLISMDAFRNLSPFPQCSYLVITDGLDICHDKATQQSILRLLCESIIAHKLPLPNFISATVLTRNLSIQSLTESSWTKHLIPEEILGCFFKMALRKSMPRIPFCVM
jgi:hypothetical protein